MDELKLNEQNSTKYDIVTTKRTKANNFKLNSLNSEANDTLVAVRVVVSSAILAVGILPAARTWLRSPRHKLPDPDGPGLDRLGSYM